jgi:hypothetical protein
MLDEGEAGISVLESFQRSLLLLLQYRYIFVKVQNNCFVSIPLRLL